MQQLDREVAGAHALVIDGNAASRSVLVQHLRDFGFGTVKSVGRLIDGRQQLEQRRFDLVVCDYRFDSTEASGQDLLEELRREQLLPFSTVFIMVTGDATYQQVAEAAEAALDSYLIKPFSANVLYERLKEARQRKRVLKDIFEAMEAGEHAAAAQLCIERFDERRLYWLYAARIGAELLLNLKRHEEANRLFNAVIDAKAVPWARLGVARVQVADGEITQARRTLEALLGEVPQYADCYDVMGRVQMEQGQLAQAMATYRTAATITPGCILRLQHCGTLAFYANDPVTATQMLERTWSQGHKSRLFDLLSMMLLAFLRFDAREVKALAVANDVLERFSSDHPQSVRMRRMADIGAVLALLLDGRTAAAVERARAHLALVALPDFDLEAATNMLSLWARLDRNGLSEHEYGGVVRQIARRFAVSKAATELLAASVCSSDRLVARVRETHAEVMQLAQSAMVHAINGTPREAVQSLLYHGEETGNAKLIDMAILVTRRHHDRIPDADALLTAADQLSERYCAVSTHLAGVRRGGRSAGGVALRC